jgi:pimeloyl-ACP methyl ester carboxylesterase
VKVRRPKQAPMIQHDFAEVNGIRLHYAWAGSGPLMLFCHGFPEFWYAWRRQLAEFGRDHLAVAPDMRGHNLSSKPERLADYQTKHLVADIGALGRRFTDGKFVLVGHDWGGAAAWAYAVAHPETLRKLVIINAPHPVLFARELAQNRAQQEASQYMRFFPTAGAEEKLAANDFAMLEKFAFGLWSDSNPFSPEDRAAYREAWSQPGALTGGLNYYRAARAEPPLPGGTLDLSGFDPARYVVKVPTLVIWGERDRALLPGLLDGLEEFVPDLTVRRIPEGSHWVVHERSDRVNGLIREFIAR